MMGATKRYAFAVFATSLAKTFIHVEHRYTVTAFGGLAQFLSTLGDRQPTLHDGVWMLLSAALLVTFARIRGTRLIPRRHPFH